MWALWAPGPRLLWLRPTVVAWTRAEANLEAEAGPTEEVESTPTSAEGELKCKKLGAARGSLYTNRPRADLKVNGICVTALLDTGASISIISDQLWRLLKTPLLADSEYPTVVSVTGEQLKILGATVLPIENCISSKVLIVHKLKTPLLIGADLLNRGCAKIDLENKTFEWYKQCFPLHLNYEHDDPEINEIVELPEVNDHRLNEILQLHAPLFEPLHADHHVSDEIPYATIVTDHPPIKQKPYRIALTKRSMVEDCI